MAQIEEGLFPRSCLHPVFRTAPLAAIEDHLRNRLLAVSYVEYPNLTLRRRFRFAAGMPFEIVDDIGCGDGAWPVQPISHMLAPDNVWPVIELSRSELPPAFWHAPNEAVSIYLRDLLLVQTFETWPAEQFPEIEFGQRYTFSRAAPIEVYFDPDRMNGNPDADRATWTAEERRQWQADRLALLEVAFNSNRAAQRKVEVMNVNRRTH